MKNGIFKGIVAILLAGIIAAGVCCIGYVTRGDNGKWFQNGDIKSWHWNDKADNNPEDKPDEKPNEDDENSDLATTNLVLGEAKNNGIRLTSAQLPRKAYAANGIDEQADTAFTFTATVVPVEAFDYNITYSIAWANANSSWASGKDISDYLTITQTPKGSKTAILTCLQPFGEQAIVTVVSDYTPAVKSTATVDYMKRLLDIFDVDNGFRWEDGVCEPYISWLADDYVWTDGTIFGGSIEGGELSIRFSDENLEALADLCVEHYFGTYYEYIDYEYDFTYLEMINRTVTYSISDLCLYDEDDGDYEYIPLHFYLGGNRASMFRVGEFFGGNHSGITGLLAFLCNPDGTLNARRYDLFLEVFNFDISFVTDIVLQLSTGNTVTLSYTWAVYCDDLPKIQINSLDLNEHQVVF